MNALISAGRLLGMWMRSCFLRRAYEEVSFDASIAHGTLGLGRIELASLGSDEPGGYRAGLEVKLVFDRAPQSEPSIVRNGADYLAVCLSEADAALLGRWLLTRYT